MDLIAMAKEFPQMTVSIRLKDLLDANESMLRQARIDAAKEAEARRKDLDPLIPRNTVIDMFDIDPSTLWRWEKKYDYLIPVRVGVRVYYRQSAINKLTAEKEK